MLLTLYFLGGNTGVGKETALQLALHGATVIIGCRNPIKGAAAVTSLHKELLTADKTFFPLACAGTVEYMPLDLSCFFSVKAFASEYLAKFSHLDILINNGGLNLKSVNKNGLQELFMVNYLSHYLLFRLLEPALSATSTSNKSPDSDCTSIPQEARVVNLSSVMHHEGNSEFEKSAFTKYTPGEPFSYYSDSKLYLNYLTMEINRRHAVSCAEGGQQRRVSAISVNPGAVRSDIWRHVPRLISYPYDIFMRIYFLSVQQGAAPSLFAATAPLLPPSSALCTHSPLLPYVVPYRVYGNILAFEMMGPFGGAGWALPSEPPQAEEKAHELYNFSEQLINSLVESEQDPQFVEQKFRLA